MRPYNANMRKRLKSAFFGQLRGRWQENMVLFQTRSKSKRLNDAKGTINKVSANTCALAL